MLKKGDKVVMHTCLEARNPKYNGKVWTCKTDEYTQGEGRYKQNLVFLEGFSGCFSTEFLQKVNIDDPEGSWMVFDTGSGDMIFHDTEEKAQKDYEEAISGIMESDDVGEYQVYIFKAKRKREIVKHLED